MIYNYFIKNSAIEEMQKLKNNNEEITTEVHNEFDMSEVDIVARLGKMIGNDNIYDSFVKSVDIKGVENVEKVLLDNRKKMMERIIKSYTKQCISQNVMVPEEIIDKNGEMKSIDLVFNAVNNYYDSLYARFNNFNTEKALPKYDEKELTKLKYNSYKKIMNGVGSTGVINEYKKSSAKSFAEFCAEASVNYVNKYNNTADKLFKEGIEQGDFEIVNRIDDSNVSELNPGDIDINILNIDKVNKSNIEVKIPLMYDALEKSYNARSTAERFFSYFPFINPTAKEERRAMYTIRNVMEKVCYNSMDLDELNLKREVALKSEKVEFYKEEVDNLNYVEEEKKINIEVDVRNFEEEEKTTREISDEMVNKQLIEKLYK